MKSKGEPGAKRKRGRPRSVVWREVQRLAEAGVSLEDILLQQDIPAAAARQHRTRLEAVVERGHATFRVSLAKRLQREAVFKGRSHALLASARKHLGYDQQQQPGGLSWSFVHASAEDAVATIDRLVAAHRAQHPHERSAQRCDIHKRVYACPECSAPGVILKPCCVEHDVERRLADGPVEESRPAPAEVGAHA